MGTTTRKTFHWSPKKSTAHGMCSLRIWDRRQSPAQSTRNGSTPIGGWSHARKRIAGKKWVDRARESKPTRRRPAVLGAAPISSTSDKPIASRGVSSPAGFPACLLREEASYRAASSLRAFPRPPAGCRAGTPRAYRPFLPRTSPAACRDMLRPRFLSGRFSFHQV